MVENFDKEFGDLGGEESEEGSEETVRVIIAVLHE